MSSVGSVMKPRMATDIPRVAAEGREPASRGRGVGGRSDRVCPHVHFARVAVERQLNGGVNLRRVIGLHDEPERHRQLRLVDRLVVGVRGQIHDGQLKVLPQDRGCLRAAHGPPSETSIRTMSGIVSAATVIASSPVATDATTA